MASGAAEPAVEDTGLDALILLLRFHEIAVDPAQIRHQYGEDVMDPPGDRPHAGGAVAHHPRPVAHAGCDR
jgi:hypothetical protein